MRAELLVVPWDDSPRLQSLARQLSAWEPQVELLAAPRRGVLYDPDATLYALFTGPPGVELRSDRRRVPLVPGDIVVIPRGIGFDVIPEGDFLQLGDLGPQPRHFRERFIQIWGFERWPGGDGAPTEPAEGRAHRIHGLRADLGEDWETWTMKPWECHVLFILNGTVQARVAGQPEDAQWPARSVVAIGPDAPLTLRGPASVVGFRFLPAGLAHA